MLSSKVKDGKIAVVDALAFKEPKTKYMTEVLRAFTGILPEVSTRKTLIVVPDTNTNIIFAARNLQKTKVMRADSLNVNDLLTYRYMILLKESIEVIEKVYGGMKKPAAHEEVKAAKRVSAQKAVKAAPIKKMKKQEKKPVVKKTKKEVKKKA